MTHKSLAIHNTVAQDQLPDRCQIACCDREIALSGYPIDRNMSPTIVLNPQRLKQIDSRELIKRHVAYIFDDRASQKGVDRAIVIFRSGDLFHGHHVDRMNPV